MYGDQERKLGEMFGGDLLPNFFAASNWLHATWELGMGMGKTKVLAPLIAFSRADGKRISMVVFLDSQFDTGSADLRKLCSRLGRTVVNLVYDRQTHSTSGVKKLQEMLETLENARNSGDIIATRPRDLHCLSMLPVMDLETLRAQKREWKILKKSLTQAKPEGWEETIAVKENGLEQQSKLCAEKIELLQKILAQLRKHGAVLLDEVDEQLLSLSKYILPVGKAKALDATAIETAVRLWTDAYWHFRMRPEGGPSQPSTSSSSLLVEGSPARAGRLLSGGEQPPSSGADDVAKTFFDLVPKNLHSSNARAHADGFTKHIQPWMLRLQLTRLGQPLLELAQVCGGTVLTEEELSTEGAVHSLLFDYAIGHLEDKNYSAAMKFYECLRENSVKRVLQNEFQFGVAETAYVEERRKRRREARRSVLKQALLSLGILRDSIVNEKTLDAVRI